MKKSIALILAILLMAILCSCSTNTPDTNTSGAEDISDISSGDTSVSDTNTSEETSDSEGIDISIFPEVKPTSENISFYREEVSKRLASLKEDESFMTEGEWKAVETSDHLTTKKYKNTNGFTTFNELFQSISKYYYPVVFRDDSKLVLWYTTEVGTLSFELLYGSGGFYGGNYVGLVHYELSSEVSLSKDFRSALTYSQATSKVNVWEFGEIVKSYSVPKGSVYCGSSFFEGIIFRSGTDVFALKGEECVAIAHNVKYVIDADYYYGSDPWCQPLFIMTDGSVKCYIGSEGNQEVPDDPSHLVDLKYEGSYDK